MRPDGLANGGRAVAVVIVALFATVFGFEVSRPVRAEPPQVSVGPDGTRIRVVSAPLADVIDALAIAAGFKVTYESARPGTMLFNVEIESPNVAQALARLLEGQSLNHGAAFDVTRTRVTSLLIMGPPPRQGTALSPGSAARPQTLPTRPPQRDQPPADGADGEVEEAQEAQEEPRPTPPPTPLPTPSLTQSPFAPRPNFPRPFSPRPVGAPPPPTPSPSP